jgi:hypothetical protein
LTGIAWLSNCREEILFEKYRVQKCCSAARCTRRPNGVGKQVALLVFPE